MATQHNGNSEQARELNTPESPVELHYHGRIRTAQLAGILKNGQGIYRIVMPSNGNAYIVRRGAFRPTAKSYRSAKEITEKEALGATFSDPRALAVFVRWFPKCIEGLARSVERNERRGAEGSKDLAWWLSHPVGEEFSEIPGWAPENPTMLYRRCALPGRDGKEAIHVDTDGTTRMGYEVRDPSADPGSRLFSWHPRTSFFHTRLYWASHIEKDSKKAEMIRAALPAFTARHASLPVVAAR